MAYRFPVEKSAYMRGHLDGRQGNAPQSDKYTGRCRMAYERGYGAAYDQRYRGELAWRELHGNRRLLRLVQP